MEKKKILNFTLVALGKKVRVRLEKILFKNLYIIKYENDFACIPEIFAVLRYEIQGLHNLL